MYLFIFESIGTSELILVGIVALIFLGPRKMPQIARKIGKIMAEFRGTASEFKSTWEREVNFEEEAKLLDVNDIESETLARNGSRASEAAAPEIREVDPATIEQLAQKATAPSESTTESAVADPNDKKNWL